MRIIKCDFCKKEINPKECTVEYLNGRGLELCSNCSSKFQIFRNDLSQQEDQLRREYEEKRRKAFDNTIAKYGLNKD